MFGTLSCRVGHILCLVRAYSTEQINDDLGIAARAQNAGGDTNYKRYRYDSFYSGQYIYRPFGPSKKYIYDKEVG